MKYLAKVLAISVLVGCSSVAMAVCETERTANMAAYNRAKVCMSNITAGTDPARCYDEANAASDAVARCCRDAKLPWNDCIMSY